MGKRILAYSLASVLLCAILTGVLGCYPPVPTLKIYGKVYVNGKAINGTIEAYIDGELRGKGTINNGRYVIYVHGTYKDIGKPIIFVVNNITVNATIKFKAYCPPQEVNIYLNETKETKEEQKEDRSIIPMLLVAIIGIVGIVAIVGIVTVMRKEKA